EAEARWVAERLRRLRAEPHLIWSDDEQKFRPADWRDMVVLLRSPAAKADAYAKEFMHAGVPLQVARAGFYDSSEITDLVSLLTLLDNPLQDVPALAVLRSPLVGLSLNELALVRLSDKKEFIWPALLKFHRSARSSDFVKRVAGEAAAAEQAAIEKTVQALWPKIDAFVQRFSRWRQLARQSPLSHCLEAVLQETHYETWLLTQPRSELRRANVERLISLTRRFDQFHRHGLLRFLRFLEAQKAAEIDQEPAALESENAVRLMSIHQSKGLEFPVVVVADLGKRFNFADLKKEIILDEQFGLCPQVKPPGTGQRYPSLPHWLANRRQRRETLGEELRLLYVALTRARDKLILVGGATRNKIENHRGRGDAHTITSQEVLSANCVLDWLTLWLARDAAFASGANTGKSRVLKWEILENDSRSDSVVATPDGAPVSPATNFSVASGEIEELQKRLLWNYPFAGATMEPAKTSVSLLRRRLADETDDDARRVNFGRAGETARVKRTSGGLSAEEIGTAHHRFLQFVELTQHADPEFFAREAERMEHAGVLSAAEQAALDLRALAGFWRSEIGGQIRAQASCVQRELAFTIRLAAEDLLPFGLGLPGSDLRGEFVVVQGVVDLAVILPEEIWLLDFKTDRVTGRTVEEKIELYRPQLLLYALALTQIYRRPVRRTWLHFLALGKTVAID
ncbi:MAG: PD-(D/E)XK nuclease family protein, partial [Verrucomicrobia bacterium]|nr:PD-(D/E)XK nuclease family protein [Verrucomicrobiota bacterium]